MTKPMAGAVDLAAPFELRGRPLRNRLVATAHGSGLFSDGLAQDGDAEYWGRIAEGGIAMVVSGATIVSPESTVRAGNLAVTYRDEARPGLHRRATAIRTGGALPISQLIHLGRETLGVESWYAPAAPSSVRTPRAPAPPRPFGVDEMQRLVEDFRRAAVTVLESGFDGVELHAAHGYLLEQFLARDANRRTDRYGPGPAGGIALLCEIVAKVREFAGDAVIGIRLSAAESLMPFDDVRWVMQRLAAEADIDYFNITVGDRGRYVKDMHVTAPPLIPLTATLAALTDVPLLVSQSFRTDVQINAALAEGADLVGMCRTIIADPDAPNKLIAGRTREIRPCTGCNEDCRLFDPCLLCSVNPNLAPPPYTRRPAAPRLLHLQSRRSSRASGASGAAVAAVAVVGGGPAGLEAALTLARAGRSVVVYEESDRLGGQLALAASAPNRSGWGRLIDYYATLLGDLRVDIRLGSPPPPDVLESHGDVIIAVGAQEIVPDHGVAVDAISCSEALARGIAGLAGVEDLVVVDDGFGWWPAVSAVELGIAAGVPRIKVLVPGGAFAMGIPADARTQLLPRLGAAQVDVRGFLLPTSREGRQLRLRHVYSGGVEVIPADLVVTAGPRMSRGWDVVPTGARVQAIGDCVAARKVAHAISEGHEAARVVMT